MEHLLHDFFKKAGDFMAEYIHLILFLYAADVTFFILVSLAENTL